MRLTKQQKLVPHFAPHTQAHPPVCIDGPQFESETRQTDKGRYSKIGYNQHLGLCTSAVFRREFIHATHSPRSHRKAHPYLLLGFLATDVMITIRIAKFKHLNPSR